MPAVCSQGKADRTLTSRKPSKRAVLGSSDFSCTNDDWMSYESFGELIEPLSKRKFRSKLPLKAFYEDRDLKKGGLEAEGSKRLKLDKTQGYSLATFKSERQKNEFRVYDCESRVIDNVKEFVSKLGISLVGDDDCDTDNEQIEQARRKIVANIIETLKLQGVKVQDLEHLDPKLPEISCLIKDVIARVEYSFESSDGS